MMLSSEREAADCLRTISTPSATAWWMVMAVLVFARAESIPPSFLLVLLAVSSEFKNPLGCCYDCRKDAGLFPPCMLFLLLDVPLIKSSVESHT